MLRALTRNMKAEPPHGSAITSIGPIKEEDMFDPESTKAVLVALASLIMTYHYIEHAVALLLKYP